MTISAYTGLPGHGKSYGVVANVIAPALRSGRTVFTNIPMHSDQCVEDLGSAVIQFAISDIIDNPDWWSDVFKSGSLIVLDELWRLWPAGLSPAKMRIQDKTFLAEHRHLVGDSGMSTEVVLVTQDLSQVANFVRDLVDTTYRVTKLSKLGADKRFRVDVYTGAMKGQSPPISKRDREIFGTFKPEIFALYQSHTKSETGAAGDETRTDKRFNIFGKLSIKLGFALAFVCLLFVFFVGVPKVLAFFGGNKPASVAVEPHVVAPGASVPAVPVFSFLSRAQSIYVSYNRGVYPDIDYQLTVVMTQTRSTFSLKDLRALGYSAIAINQCAVKISGPDFGGLVLCDFHDVRDPASKTIDTASSLVTGSAGS